MATKSETSEERRAYKREWDRKNRNGKRHAVWLAIFYEEDCPGWEQELEELGVPCLVSPRHDQDRWTEHDAAKYSQRGIKAGMLKKPHRHLVAQYPSVVDYDTFRSDFAFLGAPVKEEDEKKAPKGSEEPQERGLRHIKWGRSLSASTLYLAHETKACRDQGKHEYDPTLVLEFCGASYQEWKAASVDVHAAMIEMRSFIKENNVTEFSDFQDWCDENNDDWSRLLDIKCAWAIGNYIDRRRTKVQQLAKAARNAVREDPEAENLGE